VRKTLAAALAAIGVCACAVSVSPNGARPASPSASSPAADLRVRVNQLFGEHVYIVAKLMVAASAGRKDEYRSYAVLLATNGGDLTDVFTRTIGASAGEHFNKVWTAGNNYTVDYIVALATHNAGDTQAAAAKLATSYVPDLVQFLTADVAMSSVNANNLAAAEASGLRSVLDDQISGNFAKMYPDLLVDFAQSTSLGDAIAISIALRFSDRIPGDPKNWAAENRATLDALLQENAYLTTMATASVLTGATSTEFGPMTDALVSISDAIGKAMGKVYGSDAGDDAAEAMHLRNGAFLAYASAADDSTRQSVRSSLTDAGADDTAATIHVPTATVSEQAAATIAVIDAQRAKTYDQLSLDDRAAANYLAAFGDVIMG
jgi:hypothetical protein